MKPFRVAGVVGVVATAGIVLAGCGASASRPHLDPDVAGIATWGDCREFSDGILDFVSDADGAATVERAIAQYRKDGDHVVHAPRHGHTPEKWFLVDDQNLIHTSLRLLHTRHGWLVNEVERCGDQKSGASDSR